MAAGEISIRYAVARDDELLRQLSDRLTAFALPRWRTAAEISDAEWRAMLAAIEAKNPDSEVFIAERDGVAAGCLHVLTDVDFFRRRHGHVSVLAVTLEAEGAGVASALMAHAENWARTRAMPFVTLNVFDTNVRAKGLYEHIGYEPELVKYVKVLG